MRGNVAITLSSSSSTTAPGDWPPAGKGEIIHSRRSALVHRGQTQRTAECPVARGVRCRAVDVRVSRRVCASGDRARRALTHLLERRPAGSRVPAPGSGGCGGNPALIATIRRLSDFPLPDASESWPGKGIALLRLLPYMRLLHGWSRLSIRDYGERFHNKLLRGFFGSDEGGSSRCWPCSLPLPG